MQEHRPESDWQENNAQGKWVRQQHEEAPYCKDGSVTIEIPADELFVSGIPLYTEE